MKRVLVTGASGFIGRATLAPLREAGFDIVAIGRHEIVAKDLEFVQANLLDSKSTQEVVSRIKPTHLLHMAWHAVPNEFWTSAENLSWTGATLNLVRAFVEAGGTRAVLAGSCAEYAWGSETPLEEAMTPLAPATLYGVAKHATRLVADRYAVASGIGLAWGRIFYVYGPGEAAGRLVSNAIQALLRGQRFASSPGAQRRDFLHVADVGAAFAKLLGSETTGAVNIGSGIATSVRGILEQISASIRGGNGLVDFGAMPMRPGDPTVIVASTRRLEKEVGFQARYDIRAGIEDTVDWWRASLEA